MNLEPLSRQEMKNAIEGKGTPRRIPMTFHFWTGPDVFGENEKKASELLDKYPTDVQVIHVRMPGVFKGTEDYPEYRWVNFEDPYNDMTVGKDQKIAISDWGQLEGILRDFPDAGYHGMFSDIPAEDGRYRLGHWWYLLFERHWSLRGMTNALTDYYEEPDNVHRLFRALTDFYLKVMERGRNECGWDGIIVSDDLGTQTGPFFSPAIFNEFFRPYYKEIIEKAHSLGMHFWLHTCGNVEPFLSDFIEMGLDVIHPIQKYTMDEKKIAGRYGKDICIWAGFDVQRIIPYGTPEEVREEIRFMIDTYFRPEGRLILTAGNGITKDCPIESLEALLDETYRYGTAKVRQQR